MEKYDMIWDDVAYLSIERIEINENYFLIEKGDMA
jgi:hypothetical protein